VYRNVFGSLIIDGEDAIVALNQVKFSRTLGLEVFGSGHTMSPNVSQANAFDGFWSICDGCTFDRNRSAGNGTVGMRDLTTGSGTGGTASTYSRNVCSGNALGDSSPPGLCR
jgi:hypothetical protein